MTLNFVKTINKLFPRCLQECSAKQFLRKQFENFDDEQKLETAHHVCHQVGYYDVVVKILLILIIILLYAVLRCTLFR